MSGKSFTAFWQGMSDLQRAEFIKADKALTEEAVKVMKHWQRVKLCQCGCHHSPMMHFRPCCQRCPKCEVRLKPRPSPEVKHHLEHCTGHVAIVLDTAVEVEGGAPVLLDGTGSHLPSRLHPVWLVFMEGEVQKNSRGTPFSPQAPTRPPGYWTLLPMPNIQNPLAEGAD